MIEEDLFVWGEVIDTFGRIGKGAAAPLFRRSRGAGDGAARAVILLGSVGGIEKEIYLGVCCCRE